jgi:hypothetical protein
MKGLNLAFVFYLLLLGAVSFLVACLSASLLVWIIKANQAENLVIALCVVWAITIIGYFVFLIFSTKHLAEFGLQGEISFEKEKTFFRDMARISKFEMSPYTSNITSESNEQRQKRLLHEYISSVNERIILTEQNFITIKGRISEILEQSLIFDPKAIPQKGTENV